MTLQYINNTVTVVIRSIGERTEHLCHELVKQQIAEPNIHIIHEIPFAKAVKKTFEIGLSENRKWTLVLDADILIKPNLIEEIVSHAEASDDNTFSIQGKIIDKFLNSPRIGCPYVYRTQLFHQALPFISDSYQQIRPESHVKLEMKKMGFPWKEIDFVTGFHDYEQYYKDIYRKCFVQAKKHYELALKRLPFWESMASSNDDFQVALSGFKAGEKYDGEITIDVNARGVKDIGSKLQSMGIIEKKKLSDIDPLYHHEHFLTWMNKQLTELLWAKEKEIILKDNEVIENKNEIAAMKDEIETIRNKLDSILLSYSFKISQLIILVPKIILDLYRKLQIKIKNLSFSSK
jgi:hypothetical protein